MFRFTRRSKSLCTSRLYDQNSFYVQFGKDLNHCKHELIIECPFITTKRVNVLIQTLEKLRAKHIKITINTRDPKTHDSEYMQSEAHAALSKLQHMGVQVLFTGGHHRKLAIIDRSILYEGSLNILSQNDSCEIMRRVESADLAQQMINFTRLNNFLQ